MKKICLLVLLSSLISCKEITIEKRIYKDVENTNMSTINLKEYTDFKWDTVYIFQKPVTLEQINGVIKLKYENYEEFTRPIIFIKNGKVVYSENNQSNIEHLEDGQLIYKSLLNQEDYILKTSANANFSAKILKDNNVKYILIE